MANPEHLASSSLMSFWQALLEALPRKWQEGASSFFFAVFVVVVLWLLRPQMVRDEAWILAAIVLAALVVYGIRLLRVLASDSYPTKLRSRAIPSICIVLLIVVAGVSRLGFSNAIQTEVQRIVGSLPPDNHQPEEVGNRVVQIHQYQTQGGHYRLSAEFGVHHTAAQLGYAVGLTFEGQSYTESVCTFYEPRGGFVWTKDDFCLAVSTEVGDNDRLHVQPLATLITPRKSLYLSFISAEELRITDCFFRLAHETENVACGSDLVELIERGSP